MGCVTPIALLACRVAMANAHNDADVVDGARVRLPQPGGEGGAGRPPHVAAATAKQVPLSRRARRAAKRKQRQLQGKGSKKGKVQSRRQRNKSMPLDLTSYVFHGDGTIARQGGAGGLNACVVWR